MDKMFCCMVKLVERTMEVHYVHDTHIFCAKLDYFSCFFPISAFYFMFSFKFPMIRIINIYFIKRIINI